MPKPTKIKKILKTFSGFLALGALILFRTANAAPAEFPEYPHSRLICQEHLIGGPVPGKGPIHIDWQSFATKDDVAKVVAFYEGKMGAKAKAEEHGSFRIVHPTETHLDLTVYPKASASFFPTCEKKPEELEQTMILISQAIGSTSPATAPGQ
jgi:hypothetical protein